ncbi:MAG: proton-conducting transporter membrane subunit, partial [bacterium]
MPEINYWGLAPFIILCGVATLILLFDLVLGKSEKVLLAWLGSASLLSAGAMMFLLKPGPARLAVSAFGGMLTFDRVFFFSGIVIIFSGLGVLLMSRQPLRGGDLSVGEYYSLLLFSVFGMLLLAASNDLLIIFINIELLSLSLYALAAMEKGDPRATEAALKYFLLGSFAGAFMVLGAAFLYGATGTTKLAVIAERLVATGTGANHWAEIGVVLLLVGFAFKLTVVPFHMYAPDVYDGAPTPITALIATGTKVAGFAALWHTLAALLDRPEILQRASLGLALAAVLSMIIGNVVAIAQTHLKRMLAYSSI